MALINNGILGGFYGKVGPVSGYTRLGKSVMRSASSNVVDKPTPARQKQREKVKMCNIFMNAFARTGLFRKTFPYYGQGGSGYNRAMGVLLNKAVYGTFPAYHIDYAKVLISCGPLPEAEKALATATPEHNIQFTWINNSTCGSAKANDRVVLVAYFAAKQQIIFSLHAANRATGQATLVTDSMQGYAAETWIGFLSDDEKDAANSVYTGSIGG